MVHILAPKDSIVLQEFKSQKFVLWEHIHLKLVLLLSVSVIIVELVIIVNMELWSPRNALKATTVHRVLKNLKIVLLLDIILIQRVKVLLIVLDAKEDTIAMV